MPELPEVETVRRGLESRIVGQTITKVSFDWPKGFPNSPEDVNNFLIGAKVQSVKRRAKVLLIELDTDYTLVIHLKMTGQLVYVPYVNKLLANSQQLIAEKKFGGGHPNDSLINRLPDKSTRVTFVFKDGSRLFFNDQRKFGWARLIPTPEVPSIDFFKKVGPEPLGSEFTSEEFRSRLLRRQNSNIKAVILDQTIVAGVGNIYADESLWGAKIHPETLVKNIGKHKLNTLFNELHYVLELAIEKGGSTDKNYVNVDGKNGSYLTFARVFRREGQACPRCGTTIIKTRVAGRGTHLCPKCQKVKL